MINVGKSKIGIKSLGIRKEEKTSNGDTSNVFEHHQGNLYLNSSLRSVSCPGNPRAGPATFLDGNPILAPHLRGYPYGTDARCLRAQSYPPQRTGCEFGGTGSSEARRDARDPEHHCLHGRFSHTHAAGYRARSTPLLSPGHGWMRTRGCGGGSWWARCLIDLLM